ncbi:MAG: OmpA family protein [Proteobacteria bacterium]|nr:OmpA family protein [Pseudomonadota bacterium]
MRRLIHQLIFAICVLLPGIAGAQLIQNSTTGELDGSSLDLSQATVTLNKATIVNAANSTVTVNPAIVFADGIAFSTITVTLRDGNNLPLPGRFVTLASSQGVLDVVTQPIAATDINGVTTGEIRSVNVGVSQILATDVAENVLLDDQPDVVFTRGDILQLTKSVSPDRATIGDIVTYTVVIRNTSAGTLSNVRIFDAAAPILGLIDGTARLDGSVISDPVAGPPMIFDIGDVSPLVDTNGNGVADPGEGGYHTLSYSMVVGAGANVGSYSNTAVAVDVCDTCTISQAASAELEITSDPVFDLGTVIGKVFHDKDGDGWLDPGEEGIAGAMVVLDSGVYALTDTHGRYHFPAIKPGQRMLKINLPRISGNARATTGERQVLSVTPGLLAKANFGVSYKYESESIGADGAYGLKIEKDVAILPDKVVGSASDLSLIVNGVILSIANGDAKLVNADANSIIHLGEDGEVEPLQFSIRAPANSNTVKRWSLKIWRDDDVVIKHLSGVGTLPDRVQWDDAREIRELLLAGYVYFYQLEIESADAHVTSARHMFGVNRIKKISLQLRGGAFITGSAVLTRQAMDLLTNTAKIMHEHPNETIRIYGHTDAVGSHADNQVLSEARARSAYEFLVQEHELEPGRFLIAGFGEERPVASNDTAVGRQLNRRVEIAGDLTEVERARMYETRTSELRAAMNGLDMALDSLGQFTTILQTSDSPTVHLQLTDGLGRSIDTEIAMPSIQLFALNEIEYRTFAADDPRHSDPSQEVRDAAYYYRFVGQTDLGNTVRMDNTLVELDSAGLFQAQLRLVEGDNSFVVSVRHPNGLIRYADIQLVVSTSENGTPILAVAPVPNLVLQLPPGGAPMRGHNLVVPGYTDPGNTVAINNQLVEVIDNGRFSATVKLEPGQNLITVRVTDPQGFSGEIKREVMFADAPLFIMALADAKISQIRREGNLQAAGADAFDEVKTEGRVALYLKGTVLGKYLITAAYDTGASEIGEMFSDFGALENERLITNIDPDTVYPVYGDDSTLVYDTDSQSKLYLALEGEQLEMVVGNYALSFNDAELTTYQRTLHGLRAEYNSTRKTTDGESKMELEVFVAKVDQAPVRDEIAGTGGSLYFLSHTDIIEGSEQVTLLVRDQLTGMLLQRITQQRNVDYDIKYREGRIWFRRPVSSVIDDGSLIGANMLRGNPITIQVNYETPVTGLSAGVQGVRLRSRFADGQLTLGVSHIEDDRISSQYTLDGVNAEIRIGATRLVAEFARSVGSDSMVYRSNDGGLQFAQVSTAALQEGSAFKLGAEFDIGEWFSKPGQFLGNAYYKNLYAGFVSNGNFSIDGDKQFGAAFTYNMDDRNSFVMRIDDQQIGQTMSATQSMLGWRHQREKISLEAEIQDRSFSDAALSGSLAAMRASYQWTEQLIASLEHQQAISGNVKPQSAATMEYALRENISLTARYVFGPDGDAWQGGATWDTPYGRLYAQQITPELRSVDSGTKTLVGAEAPFGSGGAVYTEYQWDHSGQQRGLRSIAGIRRDWRITEGLTLLISGEQATQQLGAASENEQLAVIGGMSYDRNGIKLSTRNEVRRQRGSITLDQFASFNYGELRLSSGFTMIGEYRLSNSDDLLSPDQSTSFEEASIGFAIRPTEHDRWNVLFKLTRLDSEATQTQQDNRYDDSTSDLISADWSLQLTRNIEWVGKHALKTKLTKLEQLADLETNTSLSIQRLNIRLPRKFTLGTEYRRLQQKEAHDDRSGWLGEVMWNGLDHVGLGVGYNFTEFSSDLRFDSDYSEYGWFLRIQGQY